MGNKIVGCALLLGILIFLPEPSDGLSHFGGTCHKNSECQTAYCHKNTCGCPSIRNGRHNVLTQFFDQAQQKCVSAVGKACTLRTDPNDPLPSLECVEHAICRATRRGHSSISTDIFGECVCRDEYKMTKDHLCALPHEFGRAEEQIDETTEKYIKPPQEATWTTVSRSFSASIYTENHSVICFIFPTFTLVINYFFCMR